VTGGSIDFEDVLHAEFPAGSFLRKGVESTEGFRAARRQQVQFVKDR